MARRLLEARDEVIAPLIAIERDEIRTLRFGCGTLVDEKLFRTACEMHKQFLPNCTIRPEHADTVQLVNEIASGKIDGALATLPVDHPQLCVKELRRDRLIVCLRADHPLARKAALRPADLGQSRSSVPSAWTSGAHTRLIELLGESGVSLEGIFQCLSPNGTAETR